MNNIMIKSVIGVGLLMCFLGVYLILNHHHIKSTSVNVVNQEEFVMKSNQFENIEKGFYSGIDYATNTVIKSLSEWKELWGKHQKNNIPPQILPDVDFEKEMIIAAAMGEKRTGGYEIKITGIEYISGTMMVSIFCGVPNPEALVPQSLTQPYHFVLVPKNDLKVRFMIAVP